MAKVHEIGIGADTRAFEDQIKKGVIEPTEDAEKALKKLGDTDAGTDAARDLDKLEDALKDAQRETRQLADAGDKAGDDVRRGMKRAEEGVDEFKAEAQSTAKEAAASFDGSFESIGEVAQEVAANAFAGFGPAGTAAGVAVAAGAGVMIEAIGNVGEAFDEARDAAFTMAYDVGGALESAGYSSRLAEWTQDTEKYKQVTDLAVASGWDELEVLDALASGGDKLDQLTAAFADHGGQTMITNGRLWELDAVLRATDEGYLSGAQAAQIAATALGDYATKAGTATGATDDLGNAIYLLPDQTEVVVNAETGKAYENVDQFEQKVAGVQGKDVTLNAVTRGLSDAQRAVDNFITHNDGKSFRLNGRVTVSGGGQIP